MLHPHPGCLDVSVEHVSDCERLAKQCQLWDLLGDLEAKCELCVQPQAQGRGQELAGLPRALKLCSALRSGLQARYVREGADHRAPAGRLTAAGGPGPAGGLCPAH